VVDVKFLFLVIVYEGSFLTESGLLLLLKDFYLSLSFYFLEDNVRYSFILSLNGMLAYLSSISLYIFYRYAFVTNLMLSSIAGTIASPITINGSFWNS